MAQSVMKITMTWRGKVINDPDDRPEGVTVRAWRAMLKHANHAMAEYWVKHFVPLHFTRHSGRRYKGGVYRPRSPEYMQRKERQRGVAATSADQYLVWSGSLRRHVTKLAYIVLYPTRATVHMPTPSYISRRPRRGQPDIHHEVTTVIVTELKKLRQIGTRALRAVQAVYQRTRTVPPIGQAV